MYSDLLKPNIEITPLPFSLANRCVSYLENYDTLQWSIYLLCFGQLSGITLNIGILLFNILSCFIHQEHQYHQAGYFLSWLQQNDLLSIMKWTLPVVCYLLRWRYFEKVQTIECLNKHTFLSGLFCEHLPPSVLGRQEVKVRL